MQKDFHYYCIAVLARAAGFTEEDALTIAYASQYVDDAKLHGPLLFGDRKTHDIRFDPIQTQHSSIRSFSWPVQKLVFMPFHFLPARPFTPPGYTFTYVTEKNSQFAQFIFSEACNEPNEPLRLCRIGVAAHTLADTWAHRGFSGRLHNENGVEKIERGSRRTFIQFITGLLQGASPKIGHAEALTTPDQSHLTWSYMKKDSGETSPQRSNATNLPNLRNNPEDFFESAQAIYDLLLKARKTKSEKPVPWTEINDKIGSLLEEREDSLNNKCDLWEMGFNDLFKKKVYRYEHSQWEVEAFESKGFTVTDLGKLSQEDLEQVEFKMKPGFFSSRWYYFHQAARIHQSLVVPRLP
jgi:hypothetical protein